jgi:hypothetical protein
MQVSVGSTSAAGERLKEYVTLRKAAELEGIDYAALKQRIRRNRIVLVPHPSSGREKLFPVESLSADALKNLSREAAVMALDSPAQALRKSDPQPDLFSAQLESESDQGSAAPLAVPAELREQAEMWAQAWSVCSNGKWRPFLGKRPFDGIDIVVNGARDFKRAFARHNNISVSHLYKALSAMAAARASCQGDSKEKMNAAILAVLPKSRPGRTSVFDRPEEEYRWMFEYLRDAYLNQAQYSVKRAWQMLSEEIDSRRSSWRLGHTYVTPSLRQCRTALKNIPVPQEVLARLGDKAYNDRCSPYISRDPDSISSNDVWVTDQKQVDVRLRGHGEQMGRIWMVSFLDARSWKIMGYWFGPILSSDMVISAAAVAISRHGVPKSILMDLGKEFQCTAFNGGFRKIKGETLLRETQGLCQRLGIEVIDAIGRNPQTKPIERWHNVVSEFDKRIPGWCGRNTDERPEVLAEFERQHQEWKSTGRGKSPLWTIQQYLFEFIRWIENEWNAQHRGRGKYLRGMTPNECWNTHQPAEGIRRITESELELATAEHRVLKVARGGQINVTIHGQAIEYQSPELFLRQGQELEIIISRRSLRSITVLDKASNGRFLCEATAKPLFHWGQLQPEDREELRQALRIRNAAKKAIRLGNAARRVLEVCATPAEMGPREQPIGEISSTEFRMRKMKFARAPKTITSGELARRALQLQGE